MGEDANGKEPDIDDLISWGEEYDLQFPILSDPAFGAGIIYSDGDLPSTSVIAPGMVIHIINHDLALDRQIEEVLPY